MGARSPSARRSRVASPPPRRHPAAVRACGRRRDGRRRCWCSPRQRALESSGVIVSPRPLGLTVVGSLRGAWLPVRSFVGSRGSGAAARPPLCSAGDRWHARPRTIRHSGRSALAVHCDRQSGTNLFHSQVAQAAEPLHENAGRHALDGVQVDGGSARHRIFAGIQHDFARQVANGRGARSDQRAPKSWDGCVSGEDHDGSPADVRELTPPEFATRRNRCHDAAAASRNDARSPHSSASSSGWSS